MGQKTAQNGNDQQQISRHENLDIRNSEAYQAKKHAPSRDHGTVSILEATRRRVNLFFSQDE
jgi:hypothetical protein